MRKIYKILIGCLCIAIFVSLIVFLSFSSQKNSTNKKKYFQTNFSNELIPDNNVVNVTTNELQNYHYVNADSYGLKIDNIEVGNNRGSIAFTAKLRTSPTDHLCGKISIRKCDLQSICIDENCDQVREIIDKDDSFIDIYKSLVNPNDVYKSMYVYVKFPSGTNEVSSFIIYDNADFRFVKDFEFSVDESFCNKIQGRP